MSHGRIWQSSPARAAVNNWSWMIAHTCFDTNGWIALTSGLD
jgi:hypothetical protein